MTLSGITHNMFFFFFFFFCIGLINVLNTIFFERLRSGLVRWKTACNEKTHSPKGCIIIIYMETSQVQLFTAESKTASCEGALMLCTLVGAIMLSISIRVAFNIILYAHLCFDENLPLFFESKKYNKRMRKFL